MWMCVLHMYVCVTHVCVRYTCMCALHMYVCVTHVCVHACVHARYCAEMRMYVCMHAYVCISVCVCNFLLQRCQPCEPIRKQNPNSSAI